MTAPRGWCPSLHEPMESGDGLLLRVRPPAAGLRAADARLLARMAARHGNGRIDLTQRANFQPRGFSPAGAKAFAEAMVAAGLADADPAVERGRNLLAPPLLGVDATLHPGTAALVAAMAAAMAAWPVLPAKFGVVVDGGGLLPLPLAADIAARPGEIHIPGGMAPCDDPPAAATRLAHWFAARGERRMRHAVAARGADAILRAVGLAPRPAPPASPTPRSVGPLPGALGVAPAFGALEAAQLEALAELAESGDGTLRLTPWRTLLLPGVTARPEGLITDADDPRLRIRACTGAPGCASGLINTRAAAAQAATRGIPGLLHVSGCGKGCAHPGPAPRLLLGTARGHAVARDARAADPPALDGLTLDAALEALA
jgi:precorrin-3B synthase